MVTVDHRELCLSTPQAATEQEGKQREARPLRPEVGGEERPVLAGGEAQGAVRSR